MKHNGTKVTPNLIVERHVMDNRRFGGGCKLL